MPVMRNWQFKRDEGHDFGKGIRTQKKDPKYPGPADTKVPSFTTKGPKYTFPKEVEKKKSGDDHVGPSFNDPKPRSSAPSFTFGSRFGDDIRAKPHLKPKKMAGPGPGDYKL